VRLDDRGTHQAVLAERSMLWSLGGGCLVPIGAVTEVAGEELTLRGAVLSPNGERRIEGVILDTLADAVDAGRKLAEQLLAQGAGEVLRL
jgi:hydroxymethylbilane synthase